VWEIQTATLLGASDTTIRTCLCLDFLCNIRCHAVRAIVGGGRCHLIDCTGKAALAKLAPLLTSDAENGKAWQHEFVPSHAKNTGSTTIAPASLVGATASEVARAGLTGVADQCTNQWRTPLSQVAPRRRFCWPGHTVPTRGQAGNQTLRCIPIRMTKFML